MKEALVVDTNLLVRLLAGDDAAQSARVVRLIEQCGAKGIPLLVPDLVFAETLWVLASVYHFKKDQTVKVFEAILGESRFVFERPQRLIEALGLYSEQPVDFTEAYAAATALDLGAQGVVSFDRDLRHLPVKWVEP